MVFPITERQFELMRELRENDRNFSEIARQTGMDRSTICRSKDYLEDKGLAEQADRRQGVIYQLTEKGSETLKILEDLEEVL
jgi:DNA-binding MarR family transcriptional regulator